MGIEQEKEKTKDIQLEISNILLDEKLMKFQMLKIIYDDFDIKINSTPCKKGIKNNEIKDLKNIISKKSNFECFECQNVISSFEFFIKKQSKDIICKDCYAKIEEKKDNDLYISLDKYISTCNKHGQNYDAFCIHCNKNICSKCKDEHSDLRIKHEFISFDDIIEKKEINKKINICKKVKNLAQIFKSISEIKLLEGKEKEGKRYNNIAERFSRENKYAEIIISTFYYFLDKKALSYEIISNFNELNFNKALKEIDIKTILDSKNISSQPIFHIINQSPDIVENKKKIIPLSERKKICSNISLNSQIMGIIELKGGYYLSGGIDGDLGIYDSTNLELKQKFRIEGINNIYHLEKIKDENLDLIAISSDLNEIIIISIFQKENEKENNTKEEKELIFNYKFEFRKKENKSKINKIIQLSNGLIVSSSKNGFVIFWKLFKKENIITLESISKIEIGKDIYILIEIPFYNGLLCNDILIDLETFNQQRKLDIYLEGKDFNCCLCFFKEKYIAYLDLCFGVAVINIETGKNYYINAKYDFVDAIYTIDNETICICTKDSHDIFGFYGGRGLTQQFKLSEDDFVEIGHILSIGTCNCYMTDSENNFVYGNMAGVLMKFCLK